MIFGINSTRDISKLTAREIKYNNFEISLEVFMPNITKNHAITYTNILMQMSVRKGSTIEALVLC